MSANTRTVLMAILVTLVIDAGPSPGPNWTPYSVALVETAGWTIQGTTQTPTAAEMQTVLSNLTELYIRGEFIGGYDEADIDNVLLTGTGVPAMSKATLLILIVFLVLVSFSALRRLGS